MVWRWRAVQGGTPVTFVQPAPAGHPGGLAHQVLVRVGHADRDDVGLEGDGLVEPAAEKSNRAISVL